MNELPLSPDECFWSDEYQERLADRKRRREQEQIDELEANDNF